MVSAVFHYLGPAFAVLLFARVDVLGVAWLRIASAAVIFAAWRRPWRAFAAYGPEARRLLISWGTVLALMNACFYTAIARLPLATVAAVEFLPVILLAALGARTPRNAMALALAVPGVYLLTGVQFSVQPLGLGFAFANAALFALYIVLADRVAKAPGLAGIDGLAAAMLIAAVVITPIGGRQATGALADPLVLLAGIGVGLCSSVIPYVADQLALARLPRATYALMVSLLPATATVVGILVLTQLPSAPETLGVALVIAGVALHREQLTPAHGKVQEGYGVLLTMTELTRPRTRRPSIALAAATALAVFGISAVTPAVAGSGSPVSRPARPAARRSSSTARAARSTCSARRRPSTCCARARACRTGPRSPPRRRRS